MSGLLEGLEAVGRLRRHTSFDRLAPAVNVLVTAEDEHIEPARDGGRQGPKPQMPVAAGIRNVGEHQDATRGLGLAEKLQGSFEGVDGGAVVVADQDRAAGEWNRLQARGVGSGTAQDSSGFFQGDTHMLRHGESGG